MSGASGAVSETIASEGTLLLISIGFGIALMMLYDILRIFRQLVKHGTVALAIEDVIYWAACAIGIFAMLYLENGGLLRWFVLAGVALGMLIENSFISPWIIKLFVKVLRFILQVLGKIFSFVGKPGKFAMHRGKKVLLFFRKQLKKIGKAIKIGLCKL